MQVSTDKDDQVLKPMLSATTKGTRPFSKDGQPLKTMHLCEQKDKRKDDSVESPRHAWIIAHVHPSDKDNGLYARTQLRLARTHATRKKT